MYKTDKLCVFLHQNRTSIFGIDSLAMSCEISIVCDLPLIQSIWTLIYSQMMLCCAWKTSRWTTSPILSRMQANGSNRIDRSTIDQNVSSNMLFKIAFNAQIVVKPIDCYLILYVQQLKTIMACCAKIHPTIVTGIDSSIPMNLYRSYHDIMLLQFCPFFYVYSFDRYFWSWLSILLSINILILFATNKLYICNNICK